MQCGSRRCQNAVMISNRDRQSVPSSLGLLVLRVGFGVYMMIHGWGKLERILDGKFDAFGDPIGIGGTASLFLATFAEFFCALLVILGLGTRFVAVPVVIAMAVAAFVAHGGDPWTMGEGAARFTSGPAKSWASREPALLFLIAFLALVFTGAGRFSMDHIIASRRSRRRF